MYQLLNTNKKLTKQFLYYAEIQYQPFYGIYGGDDYYFSPMIIVRKLMVRLDRTIYYWRDDNEYRHLNEYRQLIFQGFRLEMPISKTNSFSYTKEEKNKKFIIISTQKQEIARFLSKHYITNKDRKNQTEQKINKFIEAINKLKTL